MTSKNQLVEILNVIPDDAEVLANFTFQGYITNYPSKITDVAFSFADDGKMKVILNIKEIEVEEKKELKAA